MPTIAKQPSLKSTQAIGAILLHQFARERFVSEGIDEKLIQDAENREHLDNLTSVLLNDKEFEDENTGNDTNYYNVESISTLSSTNDDSSEAIISYSSREHENESTLTLRNNSSDSITSDSEQYITLGATSSNTTNTLNPTTNNQNHSQDIDDNTIYHSLAGDRQSNKTTTITNKQTASLATLDSLETLPIMAFYGRELRKIADEFEKNRLRQVVKDRANSISLQGIGKETFIQLLEELFQGGITRERIVILFFFCTDVALRAVSFGQELVIKLIQWSFSYIVNTVCKIVHSIGGWDMEFGLSATNWDSILFKQLPSILISCCAALGIVALVSHLNKSLRA